MFEKEAEEYTNNILKDVNCNIGNPRVRQINSIDVQDAYKDGAEFGYNKCTTELKMQLSRLQDGCKAYNYSQHTYQERIIDLEKEIADLKLKLDALEGQTPWKDIKDRGE